MLLNRQAEENEVMIFFQDYCPIELFFLGEEVSDPQGNLEKGGLSQRIF